MSRLKIKGMTLIEILVVMGIIIVLASIISYSLRSAQDAAARTLCLTNIRSLGQVSLFYAQEDPFGRFPYDDAKNTGILFGKLYDPVHFNDLSVYVCQTKSRYGTPVNPGTTRPFAIQPVDKNSYRFVLNDQGTESQTVSYPSTNILLIENYTLTNPIADGYNHGSNGTSTFLINGKTKLLGSKNTPIPDNSNRDNSTYPLFPDINFGS